MWGINKQMNSLKKEKEQFIDPYSWLAEDNKRRNFTNRYIRKI